MYSRRIGRRKRGRIPKSIWIRALYSFVVVAGIVLLGTVEMHLLEGWSYLDSLYFTSFLATGQGPPGNLIPTSDVSKLFVSVLAFVSVGSVITSLLFLFGPFLGEVFRAGEERIEEFEKEVEGKKGNGGTAGGRSKEEPERPQQAES